MKLIKIDRSVSPQQMHYVCVKCNKTRISRQDKGDTTDLCRKCFLQTGAARTGTGNKNLLIDNGVHGGKKRYKASHRKITKNCKRCNKSFITKSEISTCCTTCGKFEQPKRQNSTSKYVGVCYVEPRKGFDGHWLSRMRHQYLTIFTSIYFDSEDQTDEIKEIKCALDRDIHILENNLPHTRNFKKTLDELRTERLSILS